MTTRGHLVGPELLTDTDRYLGLLTIAARHAIPLIDYLIQSTNPNCLP